MNGLGLYVRYAAVSLRRQRAYPASFALQTIGQFAVTIIEALGVWALFQRFHQLRSWQLGEVALFYATVNISFALADTITRGFDVFGPEFVRTGDFDRLLLRPRSTVLQLLGHELRLTRLGRLVQGLVVLAVAVRLTGLEWDLGRVALLLAAIGGGVALFAGLLILQATLAFWTVESLEVANTLTYGGVEAAQYPLDIYSTWLRNFLIYGVPLGLVAYFPVVGILGRPDPLGAPSWFLAVSPLGGVAFLGMALLLWRAGVRRYTSTGS